MQQAIADFQQKNTDNKVQLGAVYNVVTGGPNAPPQRFWTTMLFSNSPTIPAGVFDALLNLPHESEMTIKSFLATVKGTAVIGANNGDRRFVLLFQRAAGC